MVDMDTSWIKGSVGISSHWTFDTLGLDGTRVDYGEKVAAFDARAYAETLAAAGARHAAEAAKTRAIIVADRLSLGKCGEIARVHGAAVPIALA